MMNMAQFQEEIYFRIILPGGVFLHVILPHLHLLMEKFTPEMILEKVNEKNTE